MNQVNGYKLTYMGYDYLALYVFMKRGTIKEVIGKFGVGKESGILFTKYITIIYIYFRYLYCTFK